MVHMERMIHITDLKAQTKQLKRQFPLFKKCKKLTLVKMESNPNDNSFTYIFKHASGYTFTMTMCVGLTVDEGGSFRSGWLSKVVFDIHDFTNVLWNPKTTKNTAEQLTAVSEELKTFTLTKQMFGNIETVLYALNNCTVDGYARDHIKLVFVQSLKQN